MLYLVATPIGNLSDFTFRAVEILKDSDYILCEDTRKSRILLNHYEIKKHLVSFHKFSEAKKEEGIIRDLKSGKNISLISDSGTPCISDPGGRLVKRCHLENIEVTTAPGPCAAISALIMSGFDAKIFQFLGFLPKKEGKLKKALNQAFDYPGSTIFYESPKRIEKILKLIDTLAPLKKIAFAREITKKFEEVKVGTASQLLQNFEGKTIKGEFCIIISALEKKSTLNQIIPPF